MDTEMNFANVTRKFTTLTLRNVHALELPSAELIKIQQEFPAIARKIYTVAEE
jgi:hypothetical protein